MSSEQAQCAVGLHLGENDDDFDDAEAMEHDITLEADENELNLSFE